MFPVPGRRWRALLLTILFLCAGTTLCAGWFRVVENTPLPEAVEVFGPPLDPNWVKPPVEQPPAEEPTVNLPVQPQRYDFSQPAPVGAAVDNGYFADAAFVGDSRTDGFLLYSGIGCGDNLTSNGLSIFKLAEKKALKRDGVSYTLLEALELKQYGKVYLSLGVNELGYNDDEGFYKAYCDAIDRIRQSQPHAVIYIQGLIPINEEVIQSKGGASYLKNDRLLVYNELMRQVAREKQVVFLDLHPEFVDPATGQLPPEASGDGVHLKSGPCKQWLEYLKTHTVSYETLYPKTEEVEHEEEIVQPDAGVPVEYEPVCL